MSLVKESKLLKMAVIDQDMLICELQHKVDEQAKAIKQLEKENARLRKEKDEMWSK